MVVKIDEIGCVACGACADVCPEDAVAVDDVAIVDADACIDCHNCVEECPSDAISE